jgi:hypothetical protein
MSDGRIGCDLGPVHPILTSTCASGRNLSIVIERLDPRYRPQITGRLFGDAEAFNRRLHVPKASTLRRQLGVPSSALLDQAEALLAAAHSVDPLGDWAEVVRHSNHRGFTTLKGDAAVALDYRVAAEMLLRLHEGLVAEGKASPAPEVSNGWWHPRLDRLGEERASLDRKLLDLGISTHPLLVIAVEGETELAIVPKVLRVLGLDLDGGAIEVVALGGIGNDVGVLARFVGVPRLGERYPDCVLVRRPLTHLAVLADREKKYRSASGRKMLKSRLVNEVAQALPPEYRTPPCKADLEQLVSIHTWGQGGPFEFAHFTNDELADGILQVATKIAATRPQLIATLKAQRRSPWPDVEKCNRLASGYSKPELAEALWPVLRAKIELSLGQPRKKRRPPILRVSQELHRHLLSVAGIRALRI